MNPDAHGPPSAPTSFLGPRPPPPSGPARHGGCRLSAIRATPPLRTDRGRASPLGRNPGAGARSKYQDGLNSRPMNAHPEKTTGGADLFSLPQRFHPLGRRPGALKGFLGQAD